ncbi:hypothetical protein [Luteolibacter soli]|uniref:DUF3592 domain-containing protein n=1 Tax=Luteolibacter soli TaxID=3135280 RepID=A0ABU9B2U2_9BACT
MRPHPRRTWFWLPFMLLMGLVGCLLDSIFSTTAAGFIRGNRGAELTHAFGVIEVRFFHDTTRPSSGPLNYGAYHRARDVLGLQAPYLFPSVEWPVPVDSDYPMPTKSWQIRVPDLFLISAYLVGWLAVHRWWRRREAKHLANHP